MVILSNMISRSQRYVDAYKYANEVLQGFAELRVRITVASRLLTIDVVATCQMQMRSQWSCLMMNLSTPMVVI